ncbi:GNAT family N-acetyltransferase [Peribacillus muralis]|uniref:GNAT family N-acetyltransferase n=1 Tax=Peribacillus muralis TaxID=264697 RepID=UPI003D0160D5
MWFFEHGQKTFRAEVGYELSQAHWGKGAGEALEAVVMYGLSTLSIGEDRGFGEPAKIPSQKLVEKQGFKSVGNSMIC